MAVEAAGYWILSDKKSKEGRVQYANIEEPKIDQTSLHQPKALLT
jgi:hypothetical protein